MTFGVRESLVYHHPLLKHLSAVDVSQCNSCLQICIKEIVVAPPRSVHVDRMIMSPDR